MLPVGYLEGDGLVREIAQLPHGAERRFAQAPSRAARRPMVTIRGVSAHRVNSRPTGRIHPASASARSVR
ncbi:hypothetical protein GCM10025734_73910 [Kitasatospora paranensis]